MNEVIKYSFNIQLVTQLFTIYRCIFTCCVCLGMTFFVWLIVLRLCNWFEDSAQFDYCLYASEVIFKFYSRYKLIRHKLMPNNREISELNNVVIY